jgi:hypothetical protein
MLPGILHKVARRLFAFRHLLLLLALLGFLSGLYAALSADDLHDWQLRLSLVFALWALMFYVCVLLFKQPPPAVLPKLGLFERMRDRLKLWFYHSLALLLVALTLLLLQMSLKLLTV